MEFGNTGQGMTGTYYLIEMCGFDSAFFYVVDKHDDGTEERMLLSADS